MCYKVIMDMIIVSMTSVIKNVNVNDKMTKKNHQIYHRYQTSVSELPVNMDTMSTGLEYNLSILALSYIRGEKTEQSVG